MHAITPALPTTSNVATGNHSASMLIGSDLRDSRNIDSGMEPINSSPVHITGNAARAAASLLAIEHYLGGDKASGFLAKNTPETRALAEYAKTHITLSSNSDILAKDTPLYKQFEKADVQLKKFIEGYDKKGKKVFTVNHHLKYDSSYKAHANYKKSLDAILKQCPGVFAATKAEVYHNSLARGLPEVVSARMAGELSPLSAMDVSRGGNSSSAANSVLFAQQQRHQQVGDSEALESFRASCYAPLDLAMRPVTNKGGAHERQSSQPADTFLQPAPGGNISSSRSEGSKVELNLGDIGQSDKVLSNSNEAVKIFAQYAQQQTQAYLGVMQQQTQTYLSFIREQLTEVRNPRNAGHCAHVLHDMTPLSHVQQADAETGPITTEQPTLVEATTEQSAGPVIGVNVEGLSAQEDANVVTTDTQRLATQPRVSESVETDADRDSGVEEDTPARPPIPLSVFPSLMDPPVRADMPSVMAGLQQRLAGGLNLRASTNRVEPALDHRRLATQPRVGVTEPVEADSDSNSGVEDNIPAPPPMPPSVPPSFMGGRVRANIPSETAELQQQLAGGGDLRASTDRVEPELDQRRDAVQSDVSLAFSRGQPSRRSSESSNSSLSSFQAAFQLFEHGMEVGRSASATVNTVDATPPREFDNRRDNNIASRTVLPSGETDFSRAVIEDGSTNEYLMKLRHQLKPVGTRSGSAQVARGRSSTSADTASNREPAKTFPKVNTNNTFAGSVSSGTATKNLPFLV